MEELLRAAEMVHPLQTDAPMESGAPVTPPSPPPPQPTSRGVTGASAAKAASSKDSHLRDVQAQLEYLKTRALGMSVSKEAKARDVSVLRREVSDCLARCVPVDTQTELGQAVTTLREELQVANEIVARRARYYQKITVS